MIKPSTSIAGKWRNTLYPKHFWTRVLCYSTLQYSNYFVLDIKILLWYLLNHKCVLCPETWTSLFQRQSQTLDYSGMWVTIYLCSWHNIPEELNFHYYHCEIIKTSNICIIYKENVGLILELKTGGRSLMQLGSKWPSNNYYL